MPKIGLPTNIKIARSLIKLSKYKKVIRKLGLNVVQNSILATKMPDMQFQECQNSPDFWQCHYYTLNHYGPGHSLFAKIKLAHNKKQKNTSYP